MTLIVNMIVNLDINLVKGQQPIIVALARGLKEKLEPEFEKPLEQGRLLIISPFDKTTKRVTVQTAEIRNKMMIELADRRYILLPGKCGFQRFCI